MIWTKRNLLNILFSWWGPSCVSSRGAEPLFRPLVHSAISFFPHTHTHIHWKRGSLHAEEKSKYFVKLMSGYTKRSFSWCESFFLPPAKMRRRWKTFFLPSHTVPHPLRSPLPLSITNRAKKKRTMKKTISFHKQIPRTWCNWMRKKNNKGKKRRKKRETVLFFGILWTHLVEDIWNILLISRFTYIAELGRVLCWNEAIITNERHALCRHLIALHMDLILLVA